MTKSKKMYEALVSKSVISNVISFKEVYQPVFENGECPFCKEDTIPRRFFFGIYTTSALVPGKVALYEAIFPMCLANLCFMSPLIIKLSLDGLLYFGDVDKKEVRYIGLEEFYQIITAKDLVVSGSGAKKPFKIGSMYITDVMKTENQIFPVLGGTAISVYRKETPNHQKQKEPEKPVIKKIKLYPELQINNQ